MAPGSRPCGPSALASIAAPLSPAESCAESPAQYWGPQVPASLAARVPHVLARLGGRARILRVAHVSAVAIRRASRVPGQARPLEPAPPLGLQLTLALSKQKPATPAALPCGKLLEQSRCSSRRRRSSRWRPRGSACRPGIPCRRGRLRGTCSRRRCIRRRVRRRAERRSFEDAIARLPEPRVVRSEGPVVAAPRAARRARKTHEGERERQEARGGGEVAATQGPTMRLPGPAPLWN